MTMSREAAVLYVLLRGEHKHDETRTAVHVDALAHAHAQCPQQASRSDARRQLAFSVRAHVTPVALAAAAAQAVIWIDRARLGVAHESATLQRRVG